MLCFCKPLFRKVPNVQDTGQLSDLVEAGLNINIHVDRNSCKIVSSKAIPIWPETSKSGLGLMFEKEHTSRIADTIDMQKKNGIILHDYNVSL